MDPFTIATLGIGLGQGLLGIFSGGAQAKQAANEAQQARINQSIALTRGKEIAGQAQDQLTQTWANISAAQAERGVDDSSPTGQALYGKAQSVIQRNAGISELGALEQAAGYGMQAQGYATTAADALPLGIAQGALSFGGAALKGGLFGTK